MDCAACRDALSARLDDEDPAAPLPAVDRHLDACAACGRFAADIERLHRLVRVRTAEPVPDLTAAILAAAPDQPAVARGDGLHVGGMLGWLRYGLFVIGFTMLALAVPPLVLHDTGDAIHLTRELGAWDVAFGAGLLYAAWRPARARGLLPMAVVLAVGQLAGSVIDIASGRSPALGEAHHLVELVGVLLLWGTCRAVDRALPRDRQHPDLGLRTA